MEVLARATTVISEHLLGDGLIGHIIGLLHVNLTCPRFGTRLDTAEKVSISVVLSKILLCVGFAENRRCN